MPRRPAVALSLALAAASLATRPEVRADGFRPGDRVVVRPGAAIVPDNKRVDPARAPRVYAVASAEGASLRVVDEHSGVAGRVGAADVLAPARAIEDLSDAIRRGPTARDHEARGVVRVAVGELDAALADYTEAIRLDPHAAGPLIKRAHVWRARNDYAGSMADLDRAIRLDPHAAVAFNDRGNGWRRVGEYGKALADYDAAIRADPGYPIAYNNRAWLRATARDDASRDGRLAAEDARKACELTDWVYPNGFDSLAAALAESGDFRGAVEWEEKAIAFPRMGPAPKAWLARRELYRAAKTFREEPKVGR